MKELKPPTTYEQQIALLRSRNVIISDDKRCKNILSAVNYYRLTAYLLPFKQKSGDYLPETDLENIYQIYEFDRQMRGMILSIIEEIEVLLRAKISYYHVHKYGPEGYMVAQNFNEKHDPQKTKENIDREIKYNKNDAFIQHHIKNYDGHFPLWVIIEIFTFGMLSKFFADLSTEDRKNIIKSIYGNHLPKNATYSNVTSWLYCCTTLRNICAHYGRLYFLRFSAIPGGIGELQTWQKQTLWAQILMLRDFYPYTSKWNFSIFPRFEALIEEFQSSISLRHIGFPENWKEYLRKNIPQDDI